MAILCSLAYSIKLSRLDKSHSRLALSASLQAIVSALLAYQQHYQGQAVTKKLFQRGAVKELRQHNSMNFATLKATSYYRHDVADAIFGDSARLTKACAYIAAQIDATASQVLILLSCLCVIALRELAILADYSQLNNDEVDKWFALQPQFLSAARFVVTEPITVDEAQCEIENSSLEADIIVSQPPAFDPYWYELTKFKPETIAPVQDMQQATSNYLKVIGRSPENAQQGRHNDMLVFTSIPAIALPHQRWLLQLAKVSDIYLSRHRLRINSEPPHPPSRPLVSLGLIDGNNDNKPSTASETPIEYDDPVPIWKNPIILIIIVVIGVLSALAALKYQTQKSKGLIPATEVVLEQDIEQERKQQDVAIVKVDAENETDISDKTEDKKATTK